MLLRLTLIAGMGCLVFGPHVSAQSRASSRELGGTWVKRESVTVVPRPQFKASGLHQFLFGRTYRKLWTEPIRIGVADLSRIGGGLEAVKRADGSGSRPFRFHAQDGHVFGFRQLVKDATLDWAERQRTGTMRKLAMDQISSTIPGGVLAVAVIERAAGVISEQSELLLLPDDERLREWRKDFAGTPGILEHRLGDADTDLELVPGAREFVESDSLFARLRQDGASWVDARAYLSARLVDLLVGDWDRHSGQWMWARFDEQGGHRWAPIPSDRDWAFNRLDGLVWSLVRLGQPKFQRYGPRFSGLSGMLLMSQALDRRLLVPLDRAAWDSVVSRFISRVSDRILRAAVAELPPEFDRGEVQWLYEALRQRREQLPAVAAELYRRFADVVEVWGTEGADRIRLESFPDGSLGLSVTRAGSRQSWTRRFDPAETREVRIYALGGADAVSGQMAPGPIQVRLIDERGGPVTLASTVRGVRVYDSTVPFNPPGKSHDPQSMFRDWGGSLGIAPWLDYRWGMGLIAGGGPSLTRYGFRRVPFATRLTARVAYASGSNGLNAELLQETRFARPGLGLELLAGLQTAAVSGYFGLGNATERTEPTDFYAVHRRLLRLEPRLVWQRGRTNWSLGAIAAFSREDPDRLTLLAQEQPYGSGTFTQFGAGASGELDLRNDRVYPTFGVRARVDARVFPALGDVTDPFGTLAGELDGFATATFLPAQPTLAVRLGGSRAWGKTPVFDRPAIGGKESVRGFLPRRFTGDGALYGSGEVRLDFGGFKLMVPGDWGVYGLGDAGRVTLEGATSNRWHLGWGAGLWFAVFERKSTITLSYARSSGEPGARVYLRSGFHF